MIHNLRRNTKLKGISFKLEYLGVVFSSGILNVDRQNTKRKKGERKEKRKKEIAK